MFNQDFDDFIQELEYAYENVPFYAKHLKKSAITPEDIADEADIGKIPTTQKRDYRKNFPVGTFARGYNLKDTSLVRSQSSGTSGERLITYEVGMLLSSRAMDCVEVNPAIEAAFSRSPRKICRYAPPNCSDVECANPNSQMSDRMLSDGTLVLPVYHDLLTTPESMVRRALDEICDYQPDLYYVDSTHFAFLLRQAKALGITIPYAPIICTYSVLTPLNRAQIRGYFDAIGDDDFCIAELVSSSEMGWVALECQSGNLHLNTDAFYMELLNSDTLAPVAVGQTGELCISSIDNGAVPHLRYLTGDEFEYVSAECDCGYHTPVVRMQGRMSDTVVLKDQTRLSAAQICRRIGAPTWLDMYQLSQETDERFMLLLMVNSSFQSGVEQVLLDTLSELLGGDITLQSQIVPYISTERSGKFHVVKNLSQPQ